MEHSTAHRSEMGGRHEPLATHWSSLSSLWQRKTTIIAALSVAAILLHLALRFALHTSSSIDQIPLLVTIGLGGVPLLYDLLCKVLKREFGSDLLGGISIVTSVLLGEYLAGSIIVVMLSGGAALESYALRLSARSVGQTYALYRPSEAGFRNH
jgi:cation transport ATPase